MNIETPSTTSPVGATAPTELLNEVQAASLLNLSVKTLQSWRLNNKGPAVVRLGGAVRYLRADLDAFILRSRQP